MDAHRLIELRRVASAAPSPCGRFVAVAAQRLDRDRARYVADLWRLSADGPAAAPLQLTRGESNDTAPRYRADGALLFLSDRPRPGQSKDDARPQVWCLPAEGGEPYPLTDEPLGVESFRVGEAAVVVRAAVWPGVEPAAQRAHAEDRKKHGPSAIRYTRMPVRFWDHWLPEAAPHYIAYGPSGDDRRDLTPEADRAYRTDDWDLSRDGRRLVALHETRGADQVTDSWLAVIDTRDGFTVLRGVGTRVQNEQPRISEDGTRVACSFHARRDGALGRPVVRIYDLEDPEDAGRDVAPDWDVWPRIEGWQGDRLLLTPDVVGGNPIFALDTRTGSVDRLTDATSGGAHADVRPLPLGGGALVGLRHCLLHPPEVFRLDPGAATPRLLAPLSGFTAADGGAVARVRTLHVPAPDGASIHTLLVEPAAPNGPAPLLLWIHGGPIAQHGDLWHWRWNPLIAVAAGFAVALPNPRGSTGFGQDFIEGIWNNAWGAACYDDLMAVTDALVALPEIDAERTIAMGGSFGGYMTNWIGGQTDRFRALVTHAGLYALSSFHGVTDEPGWFALEMGVTPDADRDAFDRWSPERNLRAWKTPTLVIHGEKDYRVPVSEALALFEGLQRIGVESEMLVFPDENHWILRPRNIVVWYESWLAFVDRHLARISEGAPTGA